MGAIRRGRRRLGGFAENCELSPLTGSLVSKLHLQGRRSRRGLDRKHFVCSDGAWVEEWTWRSYCREDGSKTEHWNRPPRGILDLDARTRWRRFEKEGNELRCGVETFSFDLSLRPTKGDDIDGASEFLKGLTAARDDEGDDSVVANNHIEEFTI